MIEAPKARRCHAAMTMLRTATVFVLLSLSNACVASHVAIRETAGNHLPSDLTFPELAGDVSQVADEFCGWIEANQRPFAASLVDDVYVETLVGSSDGKYEAWSLLQVFLQRETPRRITLGIDPEILPSRTGSLDLVGRAISRAGVWTFTKTNLAECATDRPGIASVQYGEVQLCVEVHEAVLPPAGATLATFHNLQLRLHVGLVEQPVSLQIVTLVKDQRIVGRVMRASFWAGPNDIGRINRNCQPMLVPEAFESSEQEE